MKMLDDNKPKQICIHKSSYKDWKTKEQWSSVEEIREYHIRDRKFSDIGYHYVIFPNGEVKEGREIKFRPASCAGHNTDVVAVCVIGEFTKEEPTPAQMNTLKILCLELCKQHLITNGVPRKDCTDMHHIFTHADYRDPVGNRYCPGIYLHKRIGEIGQWVRESLKEGV